MKRVRRTYKDMKKYIEDFNHKLLSKENDIVDDNGYVKAKTKLTIQCDKKHKFETNFDTYKRGKFKCKQCLHESGYFRRKYSFKDIKNYFKNDGYLVISDESKYKNIETILDVICPNGHEWTSSYNNYQAGYKCPYCKITEKENIEQVELEQELERYGYEVIKFKRAKDDFFTESLFTVKCSKGHITEKRIKSIRENKLTCPVCFGKQKKKLEEVVRIFEEEGYEVINHDGYQNNQSRFLLRCDNGHLRDTTFASFQQGEKSCRYCSEDTNRVSRGKRIKIIWKKFND